MLISERSFACKQKLGNACFCTAIPFVLHRNPRRIVPQNRLRHNAQQRSLLREAPFHNRQENIKSALFLQKNSVRVAELDIFVYLCTRELAPCRFFVGRTEWQKEGALHNSKVFANALALVDLNVGTSRTQIKDIAEVDTAGRYMKHRPVSVRRLVQPQARFRGVTYIPTARVSDSVCLFVRFPTT